MVFYFQGIWNVVVQGSEIQQLMHPSYKLYKVVDLDSSLAELKVAGQP